MFEDTSTPRVFGLPPGVDFPKELVTGIKSRLAGTAPDALARVRVVVNTRRMARRLREIFEDGPSALLPKITLITELDPLAPEIIPPPATSGLRRRLDLIELVSALLDRDPDLAPRASLYDLADSLASLMDEMQGEGVSPEAVEGLDVSDQSGHWERARHFLMIAQQYLDRTDAQPDAETRRRAQMMRIAALWADTPPTDPIIIAGSTGSRGTTMLLMEAVARLPQGALVLPGFDTDMPRDVWAGLADPMISEDHPQYRFHRLLNTLDLTPSDVKSWTESDAPCPERNKLISLSLRPAPVTDAWRIEGPQLNDLRRAVSDVTLLEAESTRAEAVAIAMRLRKAAEDGQTAALITPDRMLTRRVASALGRWNIIPDDSAGTPLQLSPPGRFLRHVADLFTRRLDAEMLLTLLKHPLTHSAEDRNQHQLFTQQLELGIRRTGLPYPDAASLEQLASKTLHESGSEEEISAWIDWLCGAIGSISSDVRPLQEWVNAHITLAERFAAGPGSSDDHELWRKKAGQSAERLMDDLRTESEDAMTFTAFDYVDLVSALLAGEEVRDPDQSHPGIMIWGTLEARVQGADLVILGSLNDGTWPEAPPPDPWLNRKMRNKLGMLLPERRVGLSAHDFQQAACAPEVWLTRSIRSEDAETVPSRWINRLSNLMTGLPKVHGPEAIAEMRARGGWWLGQVSALEDVKKVQSAPRPSPRPPVSARPRQLSVTEIKRLVRDPYAIYAKHVLRLRPLDPLVQPPDALIRGVTLHAVLERFVRDMLGGGSGDKTALIDAAREVIADIPWPAMRTLWIARVARFADWFIETELARQAKGTPIALEKAARARLELKDIGFTLTAEADRIDATADGSLIIYDYKTGNPPTKPQQVEFDKQLLLESVMAEEGAFDALPPTPVEAAVFIGLGSTPKEVPAPLKEEPPSQILAEFKELIGKYLTQTQGFTSRRAMQLSDDVGDFDQLARFGEWTVSDTATAEDME